MRKARNLKTCLVLVAICLLPGEVVWAQGLEMNDAPADSVYDASTQSAEKPEIKTLSLEQFSAYAADICKKYGLDGPTEITSPSDRTELYSEMSSLRKQLFKQLCDPSIRENALEKEKVQAQMKCISQELQRFPNLVGFGNFEDKSKKKKPSFREFASRPGSPRICDPVHVTRDQINQKHGKYYVTPMPQK